MSREKETTPEREHALLSASGAHRWLYCTPAPRLEEKEPDTTSGAAQEGTVAHSVAEITARYWLGEISEADYENKVAALSKNEWFTRDMRADCAAYAKLILEKLTVLKEKSADAFVMIEQQVNYGRWAPEGFGTADAIIVADGILEVIDFKYGKGNRVEASGNPQMQLYALGAWAAYGDLYDFDTVRMTIFQPRLTGEDSTFEISLDELLKWGNDFVRPKAELAFKGEGGFCPEDEVCKFCKIKGKCRARATKLVTLFDEAPDTPTLSPEEAGVLLRKATDMKAWVSDLEAYVFGALMSGESADGWKLVEGRSNRKFSDEDKVAAAMLSAGYDEALLYERKLIPLTQMEKDFGKKAVGKILSNLIIKPPGGPKLAAEKDRRPEYSAKEQIMKAFDE